MKHFPAKQSLSVDEYVSDQLEKQRSFKRYPVVVPRSCISKVRIFAVVIYILFFNNLIKDEHLLKNIDRWAHALGEG